MLSSWIKERIDQSHAQKQSKQHTQILPIPFFNNQIIGQSTDHRADQKCRVNEAHLHYKSPYIKHKIYCRMASGEGFSFHCYFSTFFFILARTPIPARRIMPHTTAIHRTALLSVVAVSITSRTSGPSPTYPATA